MKILMKLLRNLMLLLFLCSLHWGCRKVDVPDGTPAFVKRKIREFMKKKVQNPPASVWRYDYNGGEVYYFPPSCCDKFSDLYDENGDLLCHPDGGITGLGDGKCNDFFTKRSNELKIWQDERK